jgi:hypothetical protein
MGFLRLMADLPIPNGEDEADEVGREGESVDEVVDEMGLGGAAERTGASGGAWSDMTVDGVYSYCAPG